MRLNALITALLLAPGFYVYSQIGTAKLTLVQNETLQVVNVEVPAKYVGKFPANKTLKIPQGYLVKVFYAGGMKKPRFLCFDSKGVLHAADQGNGNIYAMPDKDNDGVADTMFLAASGFKASHDVKFYKGAMYVTDSVRVWKCTDANGDGIYESRNIFIDSIGYGAAPGGHYTRTIVFDSINHKAYLSIGSSCNVCRENQKAIIEQYNDDGTGKKTYASGIRNAIGLALHPVTNKLWANNNGSDWEGNEIPPEWINIIRPGGFYGHPFAYGYQAWFNFNAHPDYKALLPITSVDSAKVKKMMEPAALIRAHSAPMALTFLNNSFPSKYKKGMLTALHGSWNSPKSFRGYKVVFLDLASDLDTTVNFVSDFIDGFLTDTITPVYWGRPVGLEIDKSGAVYISSDEKNTFILKIYPEFPNEIKDKKMRSGFKVYPNPASGQIKIINEKLEISTEYEVINVVGETMLKGPMTEVETIINISSLSTGVYFIQIGYSVVRFVKE